MDTREKDIEKLKDYKYGFSTDIENIRAPKGLNENVIKFMRSSIGRAFKKKTFTDVKHYNRNKYNIV